MMFRRSRRSTWAELAVLFPAAMLAAAPAAGDDFAIVSRVYLKQSRELHSENTTIFYGGVVYDFLKHPATITILDPSGGQFVLLDTKRGRLTEIPTSQVQDFIDSVQKTAAEHPDPFMQFLARPKFHESFDRRARTLHLRSDYLVYELETIASPSPAVSRQYGEFSDWYAKLNTMINVGGLPPFARLVVNATLRRQQLLPADVRLTIKQPGANEPAILQSEHTLVAKLGRAELRQVQEAEKARGAFEPVELTAYLEVAPGGPQPGVQRR